MRKPGGYSIITDPEGPTLEEDSFTCSHCECVVFVRPMCDAADMGGRSTCCDKLICKYCVGKGCVPLEEHLARVEAGKEIFGNFNRRE
jgi:hypothetical protein